MRRKYIWKVLTFAVIFVFVLWAISPVFGRNEPENTQDENNISASAEAKIDYSLDIPENYAESAIVIDADSGSILFCKNADVARGMASTTKIMTALVAIENGNLDKDFRIPKEAVGIEGSSVYLIEGEVLTLRELLYCLLLESGNDAATAIAICIGGTEAKFVEMMNAKAEEMGLKNTHFSNPHGLSHQEHRTTARELAAITAEAMKYPIFKEITSTKNYKVRYDGTANGRFLSNHNKLLHSYEGCIGVKTGYTLLDGKCLVSAAERDGFTVIAVTLKDSSPSASHTSLLNGAFDKFARIEIARKGEIGSSIPVENGEKEFVDIRNMQSVTLCLPKGAEYEICLDMPSSLTAPIKENEIIAKAKVISAGKEVYIINLEATEEIKEKKKSFWEKLFGK